MTATTTNKAIIRATSDNTVSYTADNGFGEMETREFYTTGRYVREAVSQPGQSISADDPQVCEFLTHRGSTLEARDGDELLSVIRAEHQRLMARRARDERRQAA